MTVESLIKVQVGKQVSFSTPVAATARLMKLLRTPSMQPTNEIEALDEIQTLAPSLDAMVNEVGGTAEIPSYLTFEDGPYWWDGLCGEATPGGVGPYTYDYAAPVDTAPASPRIQTIEMSPSRRLTGGVTNRLVIACEHNKTARCTASLFGVQIGNNALTGSLGLRAVTPVHGSMFAIYIDTWAGTMGATAFPTTAYAFELTVDAKRFAEGFFGSLTPQEWDGDQFDVMLSLSMKLKTGSEALVDEILGTSPAKKQIRLKATNGTNIAQFDVAGVFVNPPRMWDTREKSLAVRLQLKGQYHTTFANYLKAQFVNGVSALP